MSVKTRYFPLGGGLDITTPAVAMPPGRIISCLNFEPDVLGGYRLSPGYERFDGSQAPHTAKFLGFAVAYVGGGTKIPPISGDPPDYLTDTWGSPARTQVRLGRVGEHTVHIIGFSESTSIMAVTRGWEKISRGDVINGEWLITSNPLENNAPDGETSDAWLLAAQREARRTISRVPGAGPVNGVWHYCDICTYAVRNSQNERSGTMYLADVSERRETHVVEVSYNTASNADNIGTTEFVLHDSEGRTNLTDQAFLQDIRKITFYKAAANGVQMANVFKRVAAGDMIRLTHTSSGSSVVMEFVVDAPVFSDSTEAEWSVPVGIVHYEATGSAPGTGWVAVIESGLHDNSGWVEVDQSKFCVGLRFTNGDSTSGTGSAGWTSDTDGSLSYTDGSIAGWVPWTEGTVVTSGSSFSATIHRLVDWSGGYGTGDARGLLILKDVTGTVSIGDSLEIANPDYDGTNDAITAVATAGGAPFTFDIEGGDRVRFDQHNFLGSASTTRIYGTAGNSAFEIDEDGYISPIIVPSINDLTGSGPTDNGIGKFLFPIAHAGHLFLAAEGGKLLGSVNGEPLNFSGVETAFEIGVGQEITGVESVVGGVLVVATDRGVRALFGNTPSSFELKNVSEKQGILLDSVRKVDDIYGLSWAGIAGMTRTDQFGDFNSDTVSNPVEPLIDTLREYFTTSSVVRKDNLYRTHYAEKTPHYELGSFEVVSSVSAVNPATNSGAGNMVMSVTLPGLSTQETTLTLPRKKELARWLEAAAGGDFFGATKVLVDNTNDPGAGQFQLDMPNGVLKIGNDEVRAVFDRLDKKDTDYSGGVVNIRNNKVSDILVTFYVATSVGGDTFTTLTGTAVKDDSANLDDSGATQYYLGGRMPPVEKTDENLSLVARYRDVEHYYDVTSYTSTGGTDPSSVSDAATATAIVKPTKPITNNFLDGNQDWNEIELLVKAREDSSTESLIMYVPEGNSKSRERGTAQREGVEFGRTVVPVVIDAMWECPTPEGERIFFSGADGMVYEDRVGSSHDGKAITGFLRTPFMHMGMPTNRKRFRQIDVELSAERALTFGIVVDYDYFETNAGTLRHDEETVVGTGGYWDVDRWGGFVWSGVLVNHASIELVGTGRNASFLIVVEEDLMEKLVVQGILLHYTPRRVERG